MCFRFGSGFVCASVGLVILVVMVVERLSHRDDEHSNWYEKRVIVLWSRRKWKHLFYVLPIFFCYLKKATLNTPLCVDLHINKWRLDTNQWMMDAREWMNEWQTDGTNISLLLLYHYGGWLHYNKTFCFILASNKKFRKKLFNRYTLFLYQWVPQCMSVHALNVIWCGGDTFGLNVHRFSLPIMSLKSNKLKRNTAQIRNTFLTFNLFEWGFSICFMYR